MVPIEATDKCIDWNAIRAEYIGGGTSYRKLARKYNVSLFRIQQRGKLEGWTRLAQEAHDKTVAISIQKAAESAASNATLAASIKRKGLLILSDLFDRYAEIGATEHRDYDIDKQLTDISRLRDLTAAYKDLTADMVTQETAGSELLQSLLDLERGAMEND